MKRVTVTLQLDSSFVSILNAHVHLTYPGALSGAGGGQLTPGAVLAVAILAEARGAPAAQVDAVIPREWRKDFRVLHEGRKVEEV